MERLTQLIELLERGILFAIPKEARWLENAVEARYGESFEGCWMKHWESVSKMPLTEATKSAMDKLREAAFKAAFRATGSSEIAGLVSDDFELLVRYDVGGFGADPWITGLAESYLQGFFPACEVTH